MVSHSPLQPRVTLDSVKPPPLQQNPIEGHVSLETGAMDSTSVALRFFGDELDPVELTRRLGAEPTASRRKGDNMPNVERTTSTGSWLLTSERQSKSSLEAQITALFDRLTDDLAVWRDLTDRYKADLFCGLWSEAWNRGVCLSPALLTRISERGLSIGFDVYFVDQQ